jgi:hypothetical protein
MVSGDLMTAEDRQCDAAEAAVMQRGALPHRARDARRPELNLTAHLVRYLNADAAGCHAR